MNKKNNEFVQMTPVQLESKIEELRRQLFTLRLNATTAHVKSFASDKNKLRKAVAQALTFARQKELSL